ncbi:unnamed protein product [Rhizoctonia solani]|uniref:Uncharacterized protein n=1 Tax=Rhizoctonia solani TaxID=456999 RepID=A0A8H3CH10_9AGAM|nr:unnamed protein product [Rhizoctonia solani]
MHFPNATSPRMQTHIQTKATSWYMDRNTPAFGPSDQGFRMLNTSTSGFAEGATLDPAYIPTYRIPPQGDPFGGSGVPWALGWPSHSAIRYEASASGPTFQNLDPDPEGASLPKAEIHLATFHDTGLVPPFDMILPAVGGSTLTHASLSIPHDQNTLRGFQPQYHLRHGGFLDNITSLPYNNPTTVVAARIPAPDPPSHRVPFFAGSSSVLFMPISGGSGGQAQSVHTSATVRMEVSQDLFVHASEQAIKYFVKEFKQTIGKRVRQVECSLCGRSKLHNARASNLEVLTKYSRDCPSS